MTPQGNFMVVAPIPAPQAPALATLLATMTQAPGMADPRNTLVPFGDFPALHVARFVILTDATLDDLPPAERLADPPTYLAFLGDCDGDGDAMLATIAAQAADGLRQIFTHCSGFPPDADLLSWLRAHALKPAAQYVNWVGRTVAQIREEAALRTALRENLAQHPADLAPSSIRDRLVAWQRSAGPRLTPPAPTPTDWHIRHLCNRFGVPLILLLLSPLLLLAAPVYLFVLRQRETTDAVVTPRPPDAHVAELSAIEDYDVTNQFSAIGSVKPGLFRLATLIVVFWLLDFSTRQIYTRGRLARVGTIHFARWVFLDGHRRLFFGSNYDGSLDSYMDDFINKVAFGLNLVFTNGFGYPRTRFMLIGGASNEGEFKNYLRRHAVPTQVWYKAYPGLTAADLAHNSLVREGLEAATMNDDQARQWLALL